MSQSINDDYDIILISQALKRNTNLCSKLGAIPIILHALVWRHLSIVLFDSSSLNSIIAESNHILGGKKFIFSSGKWQLKTLNGCIDKLLQLDCTQKFILGLLPCKIKDSLLQRCCLFHLDGILSLSSPMGCQSISAHIFQYSVFHNVMEDLPMLYSYHNCIKCDTKRKRFD